MRCWVLCAVRCVDRERPFYFQVHGGPKVVRTGGRAVDFNVQREHLMMSDGSGGIRCLAVPFEPIHMVHGPMDQWGGPL